MSTISRKDVRFLVLEGFMVLFSVFAALLLEGWREDAAARNEAAIAVDRVRAEVRANLDELRSLDSTVTHRLSLLDSIIAVADDTRSVAGLVRAFHGYRTPDLSSSAWQRLSTGPAAEQVSVELIQEAFGLYALHTGFTRLDDQIDRLVFSELYHDPARSRYALAISHRIMYQQVVWARQVIPRYEAFLATYANP